MYTVQVGQTGVEAVDTSVFHRTNITKQKAALVRDTITNDGCFGCATVTVLLLLFLLLFFYSMLCLPFAYFDS